MQNRVIAIDGACHRNGKPDCVSASGIYVRTDSGDTTIHEIRGATQQQATNQRGELWALILALEYLLANNDGMDNTIITDSEYIYNSMTKGWAKSWARKDWLTSGGEPVKNRGLWETILAMEESLDANDTQIVYYHIKGHCISVGKITGTKLMLQDPTGAALYYLACKKYEEMVPADAARVEHAREVFNKNSGFAIPDAALKIFICANVVADFAANKYIDTLESDAEITDAQTGQKLSCRSFSQ